MQKTSFLSTLKNDLPAGLVVFLVALPLCLGIALASGAPLFSGLLAGIVGGLVVSLLSGSNVSVSGPAAGLTVIVAGAITTLGSFESLLLAIVFAGVIQIILGFLKAGTIAIYFPSNVIKGMLTAIGIILILKQIPHAFGYDADYEGDFRFIQPDNENTFSGIITAINKSSMGAAIISSFSLVVLILWNYTPEKIRQVPSALIVVVLSILLNFLFALYFPSLLLGEEHLVGLPIVNTSSEFIGLFTFPDLSGISNSKTYIVAGTLALVASLETLLSIEAIDKLDPLKRTTPTNRELKAQGIGNVISGLLGGLPITAVIVRGSANISAGAKSKQAAFIHGIFLLAFLLLFPGIINKIPLAALAAILLMVGYKLTKLSLYREMYQAGWDQFIPFMVTIIAIVFTDLLIGIGIGLAVAVLFILKRNMKNVYSVKKKKYVADEPIRIVLSEEVSFLNKAEIQLTLEQLPENSTVTIDGSRSAYIDYDVLEIIDNFKTAAQSKNIKLTFIGIANRYRHSHSGVKISQQNYNKLLENNKEWASDKISNNALYFKNQADQSPKYFFITCSDSRMLPNDFTGTGTGEMFVHRNIANLVLNDDKNLMAAMQYAIEILKVEHIIVCGHYSCGGINAVLENQAPGAVNEWISSIKETFKINDEELNSLADPLLKHKRMVELNVLKQVENLKENVFVMEAFKRKQNLSVHGWIYDITSGLIKELGSGEKIRELQPVAES